MLILFLKSLLLGVAVAAPLGPVGMMCLTRTMTRGFWFGFSGGIGIALADAFYAIAAALGFAIVAEFLEGMTLTVAIIGGLIIVAIGIGIMHSRPKKQYVQVTAGNMAASLLSAFVLTLLNPMTILLFVAVFAGLGLGDYLDFIHISAVVIGVMLGSLIWWLALCSGVSLVRKRLSDNFAQWVTKISGGLIICFGAAAILSAALKWH